MPAESAMGSLLASAATSVWTGATAALATHDAQSPRPSTRVVHSPQISSLHDTQTPTASRSGWFWHPARTPPCISSRDGTPHVRALLQWGVFTLIKLGQTLPSVAKEKGDFERWFARGLGLREDELRVVDPRQGDAFHELGDSDALVVSGSSAMVTARADWSIETGAFLKRTLERGVPMLCVCYGHQLLADVLGGQVASNPNGREIGTIHVKLTEAGKSDALFGQFGAGALDVHATHRESVLRLPEGAVRLASNAHDVNQAYRVGSAWAVQFHPEFDHEVIAEYVRRRATAIAEEGLSPDEILSRVHATSDGTAILSRFAQLVR